MTTEIKYKSRFEGLTFNDLIVDNRNKTVVNYLKDYCKNIEEKINSCENVVLCGSVGTGKTMMGNIMKDELSKLTVAKEVSEYGWIEKTSSYGSLKKIKQSLLKVEYISCKNLIKQLRRHFNDKKKGESFEYHSCDFLVIDEIGIQYGTAAERISLYDVFDYRYENFKPTMIISNLKIHEPDPNGEEDLYGVLGERIMDRLLSDISKSFYLTGESRRKRRT